MRFTTELGTFLLAFGALCGVAVVNNWMMGRRERREGDGGGGGGGQDDGPTVPAELGRGRAVDNVIEVEMWEVAPRMAVSQEELADLELEWGRPFTEGQARELRRRVAMAADVKSKLEAGR